MQKQAKPPVWQEQQWHWEQAGGNCVREQNRKEPTDNCHRQVKGKKEERKQIFGEEKQSISKVYLGSCCTKGQLVTNLVQMVEINILQVPHFTWGLCLTWSAVGQRLRGSDSQFLNPKEMAKLTALLASCSSAPEQHSPGNFAVKMLTPTLLASRLSGWHRYQIPPHFHFLQAHKNFFSQIGASALKYYTGQKSPVNAELYFRSFFSQWASFIHSDVLGTLAGLKSRALQ